MISRFFAVGLAASMVAFGATAQQSLQDLVSEANAEWMMGKWEATTDNGDTVNLTFQWDLEKRLVVLHVKAPDMESKGYTYIEPGNPEPKYMSFDTRGSVGKGSWAMESGEIVLRTESRTAERGPWKAAVVFGGSSSSGLKIRMHQIDDSGDLVTPARFELAFKKK